MNTHPESCFVSPESISTVKKQIRKAKNNFGINRARRQILKSEVGEMNEKPKEKTPKRKRRPKKKTEQLAEVVPKEEPGISVLELLPSSDMDETDDHVVEQVSSGENSNLALQAECSISESEEQPVVMLCSISDADQAMVEMESSPRAQTRPESTLYTEALPIPAELLSEFKQGFIRTCVYLDENNSPHCIDLELS